jgi:hypothetical protein
VLVTRKIHTFIYRVPQGLQNGLEYLLHNKRKTTKTAAVILVAGLLVMNLIAKFNQNNYLNQIQTSRTQLSLLQNQLLSVMEPQEMTPGQPDLSIDYVLEQTNPDTRKTQKVTTPSAAMVFLHFFPAISWYGSVFQGAQHTAERSQELTNYHYQIISSLEPLLEYNPRADLSDETLNELVLKKRIDDARTGLKKVETGLRQSSSNTINDPDKAALIKIVRSLKNNLEVFESTRDKEQWYESVTASHAEILKNRQKFWVKETDKIYKLISESNQQLSDVETRLRN